jgi:hypothetical protein
MSFPADDFALLVCLATIKQKQQQQKQQVEVEQDHRVVDVVEIDFDSSAALATLHSARQVLRNAFSSKRIEATHVRSILDVAQSNPIIALYVCAMLALMVAQYAVDEHVDRLDVLLGATLEVLAHYSATNVTVTPHGKR